MKRILFTIAIALVSFAASAQLTLTEKASLATNSVFQARVQQALFSKANFWKGQTNPANLKAQKQINFASTFLRGNVTFDLGASVRTWLANYNGVPVLDSNNQPIDSQILDTAALDVVYEILAGVFPGDETKPIIP